MKRKREYNGSQREVCGQCGSCFDTKGKCDCKPKRQRRTQDEPWAWAVVWEAQLIVSGRFREYRDICWTAAGAKASARFKEGPTIRNIHTVELYPREEKP